MKSNEIQKLKFVQMNKKHFVEAHPPLGSPPTRNYTQLANED
jgi:hypothetical protein